jgi:hypothetical protein
MTQWLRHNQIARLGVLLALLLAACGAPPVQALRLGNAPWQSGETATYTLIDGDGNTVGSALLALTQETVEGAPGWVLRRQVTGNGGAEVSSVAMSATGYRPAQSALVLSDTSGSQRVAATYDQGEVDLELTTRLNSTTYQKANVPSDARDQRSLWSIVRSLPLEQGYSAQLNSFLPLTGRLERVTVTVGKPEQITVPAGVFEAWRVTLDNSDRETLLWLGVDAPHTLVKVEDGGVTWELSQVENSAP